MPLHTGCFVWLPRPEFSSGLYTFLSYYTLEMKIIVEGRSVAWQHKTGELLGRGILGKISVIPKTIRHLVFTIQKYALEPSQAKHLYKYRFDPFIHLGCQCFAAASGDGSLSSQFPFRGNPNTFWAGSGYQSVISGSEDEIDSFFFLRKGNSAGWGAFWDFTLSLVSSPVPGC